LSLLRHRLALLLLALVTASPLLVEADEPASPAAPAPAEITLVGGGAESATVRELTSELMSRDRVAVTWTVREQFQPRNIFDRAGSHQVAAWIDLSAANEARLYFRDASADRFFIRSVSLPRGIDEIAREEIAHIVRNAVLALSQGSSQALTRSEARQALNLPAPAGEDPEPTKPHVPLRFALAAMAGARTFAPDLPVVARGTLSLTLTRGPRWSRVGGNLGAWFDLGYQVPGHFQGSSVGADVGSASARAGALWEVERAVLWRFAVGAGADRVHYQPSGDRDHVELASASSFYVPVVSVWVGIELRLLDWLAVSSRISVDAALDEVHFDLHDSSGRTTRVLVPYRVLPGAALGFALVY
jgi:hypothetical protein